MSKSPVNLIGISGKIGSGKDTVGRIIKLITHPHNYSDGLVSHFLKNTPASIDLSHWAIKKFAGKLKEVASTLTGIPIYKFEDQEFKKETLPVFWDYPVELAPEQIHMATMTVREFLQKLGTEAMRNGLHPDTWVNALMSEFIPYSAIGSQYEEVASKWIITDTRFPNEARAIKQRGGVVIRINRSIDNGSHPSETALDNYSFDYIIDNNGTIEDLIASVRYVCVALNLIEPKYN
jgi:hypothetical protein